MRAKKHQTPALRLRRDLYTEKEIKTIERAARLLNRGMRERGVSVGAHSDVAQYLRAWIGQGEQEVFVALFLDSMSRLISAQELHQGTLNQVAVSPREVVRAALHHNAASVIVAHNHPSGEITPSLNDENLTRKLKEALGIVDVRLLDHVVVSDRSAFSMAAEGML